MAGRNTLNGFILPVYSALKTKMGHTDLCVPLYFNLGFIRFYCFFRSSLVFENVLPLFWAES